jgi:glycosyltransferase involved in cell wall biosynthesis
MTAEDPLPDRASCRAFAAQFSWREVAARHREVYQRAAVRHARPRRLRVVYLDHCARLAGAELALVRLLGSLPDIQAHVILAEDGPLVARLLEAGVSVEVLSLGERARDLPRESVRVRALPLGTAFASAAHVTRLAWRLRRLRPDLVHASSLKACVYGGVAARLAGLPVVWHARDQMTPGWLPTTAIRLVRWLASRTASVVIADTQSTLLTLGLAHERGVVIPSPIDYERIASTTRERRKGGPLRIGVVGRIAPIKGQDLFLRAFAHAFPRGSERAVVVGAPLFGEEAFEHELRRLTHRLGATDRVEFRGFEADVAAALADLDVLVNSSVVPETLAQAVVEGMAARLPVVAPRDGGPAEVIEHDVTGVLYRAGDVEALSSELRRVAGDAALRRRLGESAQTRARQFAPDVVAPRVMSVYQRLARRERSAP